MIIDKQERFVKNSNLRQLAAAIATAEPDRLQLPLFKSKNNLICKVEVSGEYPYYELKTSTPAIFSDAIVTHEFGIWEASPELIDWLNDRIKELEK